jgi:RraA family protein
MFINASAESITVTTGWERAPGDQIDAVAQHPVALIGDVQRRLGMMASAIRPMTKHARFHGTILPVLTREGDNLAIHRALDEAQPGDVLVINGNSEVNRSVFGDLLAEICIARGVAGVVIDGAVRDVDEIEALGLPVFARGANPAGPSKTGPGTVGVAVACGNIVCHAGDAIIGDRDGLIVVSRDDLASHAAKLIEQDAFESSLRSKIRNSAQQRA